ncbi:MULTISPECIES: N-acyl homoserine lactonase family protein [unclassified Acidovorax]|uniref:N-acyl homoserine lactonase family protein n=1 Tax=unclassified Acidovorax TaxID=2684926 RepID=UPI001C45D552|nr:MULTISPECIES: N-acyl homoserine lactonase family protein [unclassified Acidovorax]MBV7459589.1 N-acyl homoserine lactonase family protein [Acidovorax sp. sif0632]MBV7464614.1 N-acyl homoserine lactonase family protein [Acidovorax sp. sif0613]
MSQGSKTTGEVYEIYALRYATHEARRSSENYLAHDPHDNKGMPLDFYFWVIRNGQRTVVVDTGFKPALAHKRGRTYFDEPATLLKKLDIDIDSVKDVVLTHMHYDHAGNLDAFPAAKFHVQEEEMAFCTGRCMCHSAMRGPFEPQDVSQAIFRLFEGRLCFVKGSKQLFPGIELHQAGGHTPGLQVVRVATQRGWVVLASDASHYWDNLRSRRPFPIVVSVPDMIQSHERIEQLADGPFHIIPGHDPLVRAVFNTVEGEPNIVALHLAPTRFRWDSQSEPHDSEHLRAKGLVK